jgi:serine/threonine-protein kinase
MGVVLAATDESLTRRVAIKALLPELLGDEELSARFLREARAMARLTSAHAVGVYELGRLENGSPFMAMELLSGSDLEEVLHERGRVRVGEAVDYVLQAVEGIAEAHAFGIVHRDLKLANLFLSRRGDGSTVVKVLDFGLAKAPTANAENVLTATTAVMGSPQYMSPEQLHRSRNVDARTDVWALGVCLYQLLTGILPFDAPTVAEITARIFREPAQAPHELCADIPVALSRVVLHSLEKEPAARYASLAELATALEPFAAPAPVGVGERLRRILLWTGATEPLLPAAAASAPAVSVTAPTVPRHGAARSMKSIALVLAGVVVGGGAVLGAEGLRRNEPPPAPTLTAAAPSARDVVTSAAPSPSAVPSAPSVPMTAAGSPREQAPAVSVTNAPRARTRATAPPSAASPSPSAHGAPAPESYP